MQGQATNAAFGLKLSQSFELLVHDTHPAPPKDAKFTKLRSTTEHTSLRRTTETRRPAWNGPFFIIFHHFSSFFHHFSALFVHFCCSMSLGVAWLHRCWDLQWDQLGWPRSLGPDVANQICTKIGLNKPWQSGTAQQSGVRIFANGCWSKGDVLEKDGELWKTSEVGSKQLAPQRDRAPKHL